MYFNHDEEEHEQDPFELFGDAVDEVDAEAPEDFFDPLEPANDLVTEAVAHAEAEAEAEAQSEPVTTIETGADAPVKTNFFSWAGFAGGLAALSWIAAAIAVPFSYFGANALLAMDPAAQAGLIALAFGPAMLFWVAGSAAGEALKARRIAAELSRLAQEARLPLEAGRNDAKRFSNSVKTEIESLNDSVAAALARLQELESVAQRNARLFGDAVEASRQNTDVMSAALTTQRDELMSLNGDLRGQTETMAHSISRQIRLMREASKLVTTEITAAENALQSHLAAFAAQANAMSERTADFHAVADSANAASASLNATMSEMLDGLGEATRLTDAARQSAEDAVFAANETASAVRETTHSAVEEAKRAAQVIRSETEAMQGAAEDTLLRLREAAAAAQAASQESQAAADRHAVSIEKRLSALAATARAKPARPAPRPEPVLAEAGALHAAASDAITRTRPQPREEAEPRRVFKGLGGWNSSNPRREAADESLALVDFGARPQDSDASLKQDAIDLVFNAGVDLSDVLHPGDLNRIARCSRQGPSARRQSVADAAPGAVKRVARHLKADGGARRVAAQFRARPDLAHANQTAEGSANLVRAYLLIDAAMAS